VFAAVGERVWHTTRDNRLCRSDAEKGTIRTVDPPIPYDLASKARQAIFPQIAYLLCRLFSGPNAASVEYWLSLPKCTQAHESYHSPSLDLYGLTCEWNLS